MVLERKKDYIKPKVVNESVRLGVSIMVNIGPGSAGSEPAEGDVKAWTDFDMDEEETDTPDW